VRKLVAGLAFLALAAVPAQAAQPAAQSPEQATQTTTPIKHFVVLMQENHSYDNYFGTYPKGDGTPPDTCQPVNLKDSSKGCVKPFRIAGRPIEDLNHSQRVAHRQLDHGAMDGFVDALRRENGKVQPNTMGYYDGKDIPYYWNIADNFVLFDRFFTSSAGGSVSNHMYWVTGTPGNTEDEVIPPEGFDQTTIFDRLEAKGISWKFYVQNYDKGINFRNRGIGDRGSQIVWVPLLNYARYLDNPELSSKIVDLDEYYKDLDRGTLPSVAFIAPAGSSEHPPGSIQAGERFVRTLINGLMRSKMWSSSAFMWTYDDWGGWFDHVKPPKVDKWGLGFRAPALLVSPYARKGYIEHSTLDFTSMLKFIEQNWGVKPLAKRDREANSSAPAFDFTKPPRSPEFVQAVRDIPAKKQPHRFVIYLAYGLALLLAGGAIVAALASERRRRNRPPSGPDKGEKPRPKVTA
jgi:phospholipase C